MTGMRISSERRRSLKSLSGDLTPRAILVRVKRRKTTKAIVLERLAQFAVSVEQFYPGCVNQFICPTCLSRIDISQHELVTDAHVIPKAAGGRLTTVLCKACNDKFGTRQDKWLGEHLRIVQGTRTFLDIQEGHFTVDGVRVSGKYKFGPNGGLEFLIWDNKTSPDARKALDAMDRKRPETTISLPVPIDANRELVSVGFLTAAYLLWFLELGYSWALQEHLELVRQQIRRPDERLIPRQFIAQSRRVFERPWVGAGRLADKIVLVAGLADKVVFLPPAGSTGFYESLPADYKDASIDRMTALRFHPRDGLAAGPVSIVFEDRPIVAPDVYFDASRKIPVIFLPQGSAEPQIIRPNRISQIELDHQAQQPNTTKPKVDAGIRTQGETGRPYRP